MVLWSRVIFQYFCTMIQKRRSTWKCRGRRPKHKSAIFKKVRTVGFSIKYRGFSDRVMSNRPDLFKHSKLKEIVHLKCLIQWWQILNCQTQTRTHTHTHTHTHKLLSLLFLLGDFTIYTSPSMQIKKSLSLRKVDKFGLRDCHRGFSKDKHCIERKCKKLLGPRQVQELN